MMLLSLRIRRLVALSLTAIAAVATGVIAWLQAIRLEHAAVFTGSTLLSCLALLCLLGVRRRIPVIRLGSVSTWTQVHIYTGIFATIVYLIHVPRLITNGVFESVLAILFWSVSLSGYYGIYASRRLPRRLNSVPGNLRFDRMAWHRTEIATVAHSLLDELSEHAGLQVLREFYRAVLDPFFQSPPSLAYVLVPNGHRRRRMIDRLQELDRYLEPTSRETSGRIAALVRRRDDLDYQYALQLRLRLWLVAHGFLSLALLVAASLHAIIALRFIG